MQRYRSGYNGTVLKTVVRQRTVGSNPTLCATSFEDNLITDFSYQCRSTQVGDEAPLLRAQVGKPAREFESLLLRQVKRISERVSFLFCIKSFHERDSNSLGEAEHNRLFAKRTQGRALRVSPSAPNKSIHSTRCVDFFVVTKQERL